MKMEKIIPAVDIIPRLYLSSPRHKVDKTYTSAN